MSKKYTFEEYQKESKKTALYPAIGGSKVVYPTLGLAGETGEVVEKIKKVFRDNNGDFNDEQKLLIKKELGDVLWYLSQIASDLDMSLEDVATHNIEKLASRKERDQIRGSGDVR